MYAELVCSSNFSFLTGASHPEELVAQAREYGYAALALTDECSLAGVVKAYTETKDHPSDLKLIIGSRFFLECEGTEEKLALVLLAIDRAAYAELSALITLGCRRCGKGEYKLSIQDVREHIHRCLGILTPADISPAFEQAVHELLIPVCRSDFMPGEASPIAAESSCETSSRAACVGVGVGLKPDLQDRGPAANAEAAEHKALPCFRGRLWLGLSLTQQDNDYQRFRRYHAAAQRLGLPLVAHGDVLMHTPTRKPLLDVVTAIRLNTTVHALGQQAQKNAERCLRPLATLQRLYPPELLAETLVIAERCTFSLAELKYEYPDEIIPASWRAGKGADASASASASASSAFCERGRLTVSNGPDSTSKGRSACVDKEEGGSHGASPALGESSHSNASSGQSGSSGSNSLSGSSRDSVACTDNEAGESRDASNYLAELTWAGAQRRWPDGPEEKVRRQIEAELTLIRELRYEHFFLTVYDVVCFARSRHILCQGRGSAANSAVCFCLGITEVDPTRSQLLFERFLSKERNEPPDIDVDFEHERREEVIQYIYQKYGRERAALAATVITYRGRSALRDVGRALGLDAALIDHLAKSLAWWDKPADLVNHLEEAGVPAASRTARQLIARIQEIRRFPRHLSQHVGGFVISRGPVSELVPVENAAMPERSVIQWDKDDLESLGLLKVDVLSLGMLTAIRKTFALIEQHGLEPDKNSGPQYEALAPCRDRRQHSAAEEHGASRSQDHRLQQPQDHRRQADVESLPGPGRRSALTMASLPQEDSAVYAMLSCADSVGVFQVESRAQMSMLPRLKPRTFYDLVVQVAIVRPGPVQGGMVHPYLNRRAGREPVDFPNEAVRQVLARTYGVPIFQEQVIKMAMVAAGFTGGEADQLRRAMASWKLSGKLAPFERKLKDGMRERGYAAEYADRLWNQILGFGEYGFPESHAASFALLVYVSAWLKCHHPAAFCCGLLNSLPMGFYSPSQLIQDAMRHGIEVRPVRVGHSDWDHTLERIGDGEGGSVAQAAPTLSQDRQQKRFDSRFAIRLGLRLVSGFNADAAERVRAARAQQPFHTLQDLKERASLSRLELDALIAADALVDLSGHRPQSQWQAAALAPAAPLLGDLEQRDEAYLSDGVIRPAPSAVSEVLDDYGSLGLTLKQHPMMLLRAQKLFARCKRASDLAQLRHGQFLRLAGIVTGRQRPGTASGIIFLTLEDETGNSNVVVKADVQERCRKALLGSHIVLVKGIVENREGVVHVLAGHIEDVSDALSGLEPGSRDFH